MKSLILFFSLVLSVSAMSQHHTDKVLCVINDNDMQEVVDVDEEVQPLVFL